jgi:hypothetical protein
MMRARSLKPSSGSIRGFGNNQPPSQQWVPLFSLFPANLSEFIAARKSIGGDSSILLVRASLVQTHAHTTAATNSSAAAGASHWIMRPLQLPFSAARNSMISCEAFISAAARL